MKERDLVFLVLTVVFYLFFILLIFLAGKDHDDGE